MKIAIFDSGIGGLTVLHEAMKLMPDEDYLFYADTRHVPYGEKSKDEVKQYVMDAAQYMADQHVKAIVLACNTATSIAVSELRAKYDFPILGIEPAVKPAVQNSVIKHKKVLVMATRLTLNEEKFHNLVKSIDTHDLVESLPMPGLVELAECRQFDDDHVMAYLDEALAGYKLDEYGTVVLGCTHFPFFKDQLRRYFPEEVDIIDGSNGTARHLQHVLEARGQLGGGNSRIEFVKSGEPANSAEELTDYHDLLNRLSQLS
ncbi:glutamate racemase [Paenibacillus sp. WLX1005]|uniref:glutamate racemase n=1 Tax=Paenibacillus sp. WLX1005 TaxID=3243766 RepID=UPI00398438C5